MRSNEANSPRKRSHWVNSLWQRLAARYRRHQLYRWWKKQGLPKKLAKWAVDNDVRIVELSRQLSENLWSSTTVSDTSRNEGYSPIAKTREHSGQMDSQ